MSVHGDFKTAEINITIITCAFDINKFWAADNRKGGCTLSLDGAFLHIVKNELLSALSGARVDKIYQPAREEIIIALRGYNGSKKLLMSANSASARVNLTESAPDNPAQPPMFCMLLRKHLCGGRLSRILQDGLERILRFDFECVNELGDRVLNSLVVEIMGGKSNIILVRDGRVIDSIKRFGFDAENPSARCVLPNIAYEPPSRPERLVLTETEPTEVWERICGSRERLSKRLVSVLEGISPIFARECAYYAAKDTDVICSELSDSARDRVLFFLSRARKALDGEAVFTVVSDKDGRKKDFCFMNIEQYSTAMLISHVDSANGLLDKFFALADRQTRTKQRARDLMKLLMTSFERVSRKLELRKKELAQCSERDVFRVSGDLINANLYRLEKGMTSVVLENFESGEPVTVALDPRLTPAQNAQKYYAEYKKLVNAEKVLYGLIEEGERELKYIDSVFDSVSRTDNETELSEIRAELRESGYLRGAEKPEERVKKHSEPLEFRSGDGFEILVGKNNRQNDLLTTKTAKATDIWLHTQNIAGSHVIIKTDGRTPSESTLTEAAQIAAYHSKAREGSRVPVDYTAVKFVKKPAGAKPGMVIFTNNKTLFVTPSEEIVNKLSLR